MKTKVFLAGLALALTTSIAVADVRTTDVNVFTGQDKSNNFETDTAVFRTGDRTNTGPMYQCPQGYLVLGGATNC